MDWHGAETSSGNFIGNMEPHLSYEVSFSSSIPMDENYDYDDNIIQDYVEELIRDDGSRKGFEYFEFVMNRGWYSGAVIDGTVTWWTGNYSAEEFNVEFDDWADQEMLTHGKDISFKQWAKEEGKKHGDMDLTDWAKDEEESHDERYDAESFETIIEKIDKEYSESGITADATDIYYELVKRHGARNKKDKKNQIKRALENFYQIDLEDFEAPSYGNYYGACLLPDGSCTETSLDMCRSLGGRFQGPGTSCYPDDPYLKPRIMRAESSNRLGKGLTIGIVAGIVSGLVTTVFGTVISEILLDRLREDPELEITDEDVQTP